MMKLSRQPTTTLSLMEKDFILSINLFGEKWKKAKGYSLNYYVSNMGRILTTRKYGGYKVAVMKPAHDANGYLRTVMNGKTIKVHRIVAKNWLENPLKHPVVNHINGKRDDNRAENIEWCTKKYNAWMGVKIGSIKIPIYSRNMMKLGKKNRQLIRKYYLENIVNLKHSKKTKHYDLLQKKYPQVKRSTLQKITTNQSWSKKQSLTIPSVCKKHHTHIISEKNIIL